MAQSVERHLGKDLIIGLTHIINSNLTTIYRLFCNFQTIYRPPLKLVSKLVSKFQKNWQNYACMAQQVAHSLGKAEVVSSSLIASSIEYKSREKSLLFLLINFKHINTFYPIF